MTTENVSVAEAARLRKVSIIQIYRDITGGRLYAERVDGRWRIPMDALQKRMREVAERKTK